VFERNQMGKNQTNKSYICHLFPQSKFFNFLMEIT